MQDNSKKSSGCTKWAVGCGFAFVILVLVLGAAGYFIFKVTGGAFSGIKRITEIGTMDNNIVNQSPYSPPSDGMLSLEQVETLVYIQREIKDAIGSDYEELMSEYSSLIGEMDEASDLKKIKMMFSLSGKLIGPLHRAKEAQIDAINRKGISGQEYEWLKTQGRLAFDLPANPFNLQHMIENMKNGSASQDTEVIAPVSHPQNRMLLESHREILVETLVLTAIGL